MMATRLTDSELAQRVRAGNRIRAQRQQERRRTAGLVQLNVWVSQSTRTALDSAAAHRNMTVSETVSDLLERALSAAMLLNTTTTPDTPAPAGNSTTRDELMTMNTALGNVADKLSATSDLSTVGVETDIG